MKLVRVKGCVMFEGADPEWPGCPFDDDGACYAAPSDHPISTMGQVDTLPPDCPLRGHPVLIVAIVDAPEIK